MHDEYEEQAQTRCVLKNYLKMVNLESSIQTM